MNLHTCLLTNNDCYKANRTITPKGVMVHSTGANNPNLRRYVQPNDGLLGENRNGNDWNRPISPAVCVHGFVGRMADGTVAAVQTLPWDIRCWGCGSGPKGSYNESHIQFEICEDGMEDPAYLAQAWQEAVDLCVYLCRAYAIPVSAIRSHAEGHRDGYASNHGDPDHWFRRFGRTMDDFRADVTRALAPDSPFAAAVQKRFQLSDETMRYLQGYRFAQDLLKKLAELP